MKHAKLSRILPPQCNTIWRRTLTSSSIASDLQDYINSESRFQGQKIHSHIIKTGFRLNVNISIKLLILYLKLSYLSYARRVFDELPRRTLSAYNYMISGYVKNGEVQKSFDLVRELHDSGENPDGYTYSMILKASTSGACTRLVGRAVHAQILKNDIEGDDVLYTALVDSYVKSCSLEYARKVFDLMLVQNVISSTSMITGYMDQGLVEEAEDVFARTFDKDVVACNAMIEGYSKSVETSNKAIQMYVNMRRHDYHPTISTYASIIGACSLLSAFEIGRQVQAQLMKTELFTDIKMGSALVDMYSKCGRTDDARCIFDHMPQRNVFTWTSMIDGYGKNGCPNESLQLFDIMLRESNTSPNYVTFLGALSACVHAGLVARGQQIFYSMERDYNMKPRMEHYACMVDLFGRAGKLKQAFEFVMQMPETPNADVWTTMLSCCNLHGEAELAEIAANQLLKRKKEKIKLSGPYVTFSNALADARRWDDVSQLRELMKGRGISKGTGVTWIEADSGLETFHAAS